MFSNRRDHTVSLSRENKTNVLIPTSPKKHNSFTVLSRTTVATITSAGEESIETHVNVLSHLGKSVDTTADETMQNSREEESFRVSPVDFSREENSFLSISDDQEVAAANGSKVDKRTKTAWKWAKKPLSRISRRRKQEQDTTETTVNTVVPESALDISSNTLIPKNELNLESSILNITDDTYDHDEEGETIKNIEQRDHSINTPSPNGCLHEVEQRNDEQAQKHAQCCVMDNEKHDDIDDPDSILNSISESFIDGVCTPLDKEDGFISRAVLAGDDCGCGTDAVVAMTTFDSNNACFASLGDVFDSAAKSVQNRVEQDLEYLLGCNDPPSSSELDMFRAVSSGWDGDQKNTEAFTSEGDVGRRGCDSSEEDREIINGGKINPLIRNRAGENLKARADWIRRLRKERTVRTNIDNHDQELESADHFRRHHASPLRTGDEPISEIKQSRSMDESCLVNSSYLSSHDAGGADAADGFGMTMDGSFLGIGPSMGVDEDLNEHTAALSRMIGDCVDPIPLFEDDEERKVEKPLEDEDLCYDSDPGTECHRRLHRKNHRGHSSNTAPTKQSSKNSELICKFEDMDDAEPFYSESEFQAYPSSGNHENLNGDNNFYSNDEYSRRVHDGESAKDDMFVALSLQESFNKTWTLIWHPLDEERKAGEISSLPSPKCVEVWFERGCSIHNFTEAVEPKLMWREAHQLDIANNRSLNATTKQPHHMPILTICRILEMDVIPSSSSSSSCFQTTKKSIRSSLLAKKSCSLVLRNSNDQEFVFEARSEAERDEIAHDWKLVVARLASHAIVGNGSGMLDEFFVNDFEVPGGVSIL